MLSKLGNLILQGDTDQVLFILETTPVSEKKALIHEFSGQPLSFAVLKNNARVVEALILNGVEYIQSCALFDAVRWGHKEVETVLRAHGASEKRPTAVDESIYLKAKEELERGCRKR